MNFSVSVDIAYCAIILLNLKSSPLDKKYKMNRQKGAHDFLPYAIKLSRIVRPRYHNVLLELLLFAYFGKEAAHMTRPTSSFSDTPPKALQLRTPSLIANQSRDA